MPDQKSYIPLKKITEFHHGGNVYAITSAAIRRAEQLTAIGCKSGDEDCHDRIISDALTDVLTNKVHYKAATDDNEPLS